MARPSSGANLNIADLERMLEDRKNELNKLLRQRSDLQKRVDQIDRQIERLGGGAVGRRGGRGGRGGGRARNERSLMDTIEAVMREAGRAMKVHEIVEAVEATGYRSNSANFRGIVNQTLIKDRKRFVPTDRGVYQLKSDGSGGGRGKRGDKDKEGGKSEG